MPPNNVVPRLWYDCFVMLASPCSDIPVARVLWLRCRRSAPFDSGDRPPQSDLYWACSSIWPSKEMLTARSRGISRPPRSGTLLFLYIVLLTSKRRDSCSQHTFNMFVEDYPRHSTVPHTEQAFNAVTFCEIAGECLLAAWGSSNRVV